MEGGWLRCTLLPVSFLNGGAQWCCVEPLRFPVVQDIMDGGPQNPVLYVFAQELAFCPCFWLGVEPRWGLCYRAGTGCGFGKVLLGVPHAQQQWGIIGKSGCFIPSWFWDVSSQRDGAGSGGGERKLNNNNNKKKGNGTCCKESEFPNKPESAENTFYKHAAKLAAFVWAFVKH